MLATDKSRPKFPSISFPLSSNTMLKIAIKRDGTHEAAQPHKLHNWVQWGAGELLGDRIDWSGICMDTTARLGEVETTVQINKTLVDVLIEQADWPHNLMAGRIYAADLRKQLYNNKLPTMREMYEKLLKLNFMEPLPYSDSDWEKIEKIIDHDRDFTMAHFQISQIHNKYSIQDRHAKVKFEMPQYVFMRMALALSKSSDKDVQLSLIRDFYDYFSFGRINSPTTNYVYLGTPMHGLASCCLYSTSDTADSIDVGDSIISRMTKIGAGIGGMINVRSPGDPVRNGAIIHKGKMDYLRSAEAAVKKNTKAGRDGACTQYYSVYDPEAISIATAQNPKATDANRIRGLHFAAIYNRFFADCVFRDDSIFTFNCFTAPVLFDLIFSGNEVAFEQEYNRLLADSSFKKTFVRARDVALAFLIQEQEVSTNYEFNATEVNWHTPFKELIRTSNLCLEVCQPHFPYENEMDLYLEEDHGRGEISVCSLGAINVATPMTDEQYLRACYLTLLMIDECIHLSDYPYPHLKFTAKQRMNAGVGMIGVATVMARAGVKYGSLEGRNLLHKLSERHMYFMIKASLQLGREKGNAPWMHKTKWPEGWLPIDTYNRSIDEIVTESYHYPWEELRADVVENGGIRNSCLVAHMPTESSSKASGPPNGLYPIRGLSLLKTDQGHAIDWVPIDGDLLGDAYENAFDTDPVDMAMAYGVVQKFTDHASSADGYMDRIRKPVLKHSDLVRFWHARVKYGNKTAYYTNTRTPMNATEQSKAPVCGSGGCTL